RAVVDSEGDLAARVARAARRGDRRGAAACRQRHRLARDGRARRVLERDRDSRRCRVVGGDARGGGRDGRGAGIHAPPPPSAPPPPPPPPPPDTVTALGPKAAAWLPATSWIEEPAYESRTVSPLAKPDAAWTVTSEPEAPALVTASAVPFTVTVKSPAGSAP